LFCPTTAVVYDLDIEIDGYCHGGSGGFVDLSTCASTSSINFVCKIGPSINNGGAATAGLPDDNFNQIRMNGTTNRALLGLGSEWAQSSASSIIAGTTANKRSSQIQQVGAPFIPIELAIPSLAANATADFYVYHQATTGNNTFDFIPQTTLPLLFNIIEDESVAAGVTGVGPHPNEIHIRAYAIAAVSATNITGVLKNT
jgi:hypothetical protein